MHWCRVTDFLRWYFGMLNEVFRFADCSAKRGFGKLSGVCGMIAVDWIRSEEIARVHCDMWKRYIECESSRVNFERRMYAELSNGLARNVNEISINARIHAVTSAYHRDGFAEYNNDVELLLSGAGAGAGAGDNNSDDE